MIARFIQYARNLSYIHIILFYAGHILHSNLDKARFFLNLVSAIELFFDLKDI